jgi:CheY-specific phosphatase CheX
MVDFGEDESCESPIGYGSEIDLEGRQERVSISLRVSEEFARMITANFLGMQEDQISEDDLKDSLMELANMVGGGYQARISDRCRQLGIPRISALETEGTDDTQSVAALNFAYFGEPAGSAFLNIARMD